MPVSQGRLGSRGLMRVLLDPKTRDVFLRAFMVEDLPDTVLP